MALDQQKPETAIQRSLAWVDQWAAERELEKAELRRASDYAGDNPMAHHSGENPRGGMTGAADVFSGLGSPERSKFLAGEAIVIARRRRAGGDLPGAKYWLRRATRQRRKAAALVTS